MQIRKRNIDLLSTQTRLSRLEKNDKYQGFLNLCVLGGFLLLLFSDLLGHGFIKNSSEEHPQRVLQQSRLRSDNSIGRLVNSFNQIK